MEIMVACEIYILQLFKGTVSRDFQPRFFSSSNPPRVLIHGPNAFRIWLRIRRDIQDNHWQSSDSAVSMRTRDRNPRVSMTPRDRIPRSQWHRGIQHENFCIRFSWFEDAIEADPAVSLTSRDTILAIFESIFWAITKPYANGFSPWIRALGGIV
jgi:hypothetical protein